jgi:hypothetical protein
MSETMKLLLIFMTSILFSFHNTAHANDSLTEEQQSFIDMHLQKINTENVNFDTMLSINSALDQYHSAHARSTDLSRKAKSDFKAKFKPSLLLELIAYTKIEASLLAYEENLSKNLKIYMDQHIESFSSIFKTSHGSSYYVLGDGRGVRIRNQRKSPNQGIVTISDKILFVDPASRGEIYDTLRSTGSVTLRLREPKPGLIPIEYINVETHEAFGTIKVLATHNTLYHFGNKIDEVVKAPPASDRTRLQTGCHWIVGFLLRAKG